MKILIAGDFVPRRRTAVQIDAGDYSSLEQVKPIIQAADYAIVNFESPVMTREALPIKKTGPNLRCTESAMKCVAQSGFKCVTLANNHFFDYGQIGVEDTIDSCEKHHIDFVGGGKTQAEAEQVLFKNINGQILAIINCCEHEWSIATIKHGGSNPLDIISVCRAIQTAKQKAEFVLVIIHGGTEGYNLPTPRMKQTYRFFVEQGADAVVNHHQHCFSGYEVYQGKPIFYGLGNFCFDKLKASDDKLWEEGFMVELQFDKTIGFKLYPYVQCDEKEPVVRLIEKRGGFEDAISSLNCIIADDSLLNEQFERLSMQRKKLAKDILSPYSFGILTKLYSKGLLPSFASDKRMRKLCAFIQCESHRDILLSVLNTHLKK